MANLKINPNFKIALQNCFEEFVQIYADLARNIIENERVWKGWETSNPLRDIVDTNALNESMDVVINGFKGSISWEVAYVTYVYFGYTLPDGRRIPARRWAELVYQENDLVSIFTKLLTDKYLNHRV